MQEAFLYCLISCGTAYHGFYSDYAIWVHELSTSETWFAIAVALPVPTSCMLRAVTTCFIGIIILVCNPHHKNKQPLYVSSQIQLLIYIFFLRSLFSSKPLSLTSTKLYLYRASHMFSFIIKTRYLCAPFDLLSGV